MNQKCESFCQEALQFAEQLAFQYFVKRELESLPQFMDPTVSWIGTGSDEISRNFVEAEQALRREMEEYNGVFSITEESFQVAACSESLCIVYGTICATPEDTSISEENLRLTVVLKKKGQEMRMVHLHMSHPDPEQETGHYFVSKNARNNTQMLQRALDLRTRQLDILNSNIPGGAHQCKNDPNFTIISMSESFLSMFGYTREEVHTIFHDHFIEMVYPADRAGMLSAAHEQLKMGTEIELEYRVLCKNGAPVWILDKGRLLDDGNDGTNFYCLLIEITERKRAQEELRLSLERYQIIIDQATDIIFEWDIPNDTLNFSPNWRKKFGYDAINRQISDNIPLSRNIHPEDMPAFVKIMKDTAAGVPYSETEFRIKNSAGHYFWNRIRATAQYDDYGRAIKAVGVIVDIDSEKRQKQELLDQAQKDALTGLYNKATINSLVDRKMQGNFPDTLQALLILDVDHFKLVNDTYGHLTGDSLLSDVAAAIKSQIRSTDLAGRIGGDEFLIYLPEVLNESVVQEKVEKLLGVLTLLTPEPGAAPISCSVGAAVLPRGQVPYHILYQYADSALYARKNSGRGGVTFYREKDGEATPFNSSSSAVSGDVGSDENSVMDEQLAQYAFRTLYTAVEIEPALNRLLEIIGRSYDVSRAYIFESSEDRTTCSNTFEWCAEGVESQIASLQNISYIDDLGDYLKNFNAQGIFFCDTIQNIHPDVRAVLEPQGIRSMLQCAILDEGEFVGYVGFDECRENRTWSKQQVASFKLTANVLSAFLVKMRLKQKLNQAKPSPPVK